MKTGARAVGVVLQVCLLMGSLTAVRAEGESAPAPASASPAVIAPGPPVSVDADQLAARMKTDQDLYKQIRDHALAAYAKLHPAPSAGDEEARATIRLGTYLFVWGDFYREGLWENATYHVMALTRAGLSDPLLQALPIIHAIELKRFARGQAALDLDQGADRLTATDYPAAFKFWYEATDAQNLAALKIQNQAGSLPVPTLLLGVIDKAAAAYGELIKNHVDPDLLERLGGAFFHGLQGDDESLNAAGDRIDKAFIREDPANVAREVLQARYDIASAWTMRGVGNADKVTPEGWKLFKERLEQAAALLESAYLKHPNVGMVSTQMLTVELGQGQGRERMELWFGRAIKANPDDFQAYTAKAYYLQPKWYGSDADTWSFGVECAKTQNWPAKIPMVLIDSLMNYLWKQDPGILKDDEKWGLIETTFRGYLAQYPQSNYYRSIFARWATEGGHWKVAQEQFKILGDQWDPMVFPNSRYPEMKGLSDKNAPVTGP